MQSRQSAQIVNHGLVSLVGRLRGECVRYSHQPYRVFGTGLLQRLTGLTGKLSSELSSATKNQTAPNGGFYMAPATAQRFRVAVEGNGFGGELSADAAGIVATLFTLSHLSMSEAAGSSRDALADSFHALRDFVSTHPEAALILRAID